MTRRDQCPHGHAYTPENTLRDQKGARMCRACKRARDRAYYREIRERRAFEREFEAVDRRSTLEKRNAAFLAALERYARRNDGKMLAFIRRARRERAGRS